MCSRRSPRLRKVTPRPTNSTRNPCTHLDSPQTRRNSRPLCATATHLMHARCNPPRLKPRAHRPTPMPPLLWAGSRTSALQKPPTRSSTPLASPTPPLHAAGSFDPTVGPPGSLCLCRHPLWPIPRKSLPSTDCEKTTHFYTPKSSDAQLRSKVHMFRIPTEHVLWACL